MTQISGAPSVRNARKMSSENVQNVQSKLLNIYWLIAIAYLCIR